MSRIVLPKIELQARDDITFRLHDRAVALWDKTIVCAKDEVTIPILSPIYPDKNAFSVEDMMAALEAAAKRPITLNINSPGGSYFEGITIFNLLRDYPNRITVNVLGQASSAASVVAMAGDRIRMHSGALMMIHGASGLAMGNKKDMRDLADVLDKIDNVVADVYAARTGNKREKILEMMEAETWMTPEDCVKNRFAEEVVKDTKAKKPTNSAAAPQPSALAASGDKRSMVVSLSAKTAGAAAPKFKGTVMQTNTERVQALEAKRAATVARMEALSTAASQRGESFDEAEQQEFDTLDGEVRAADAQLVRDRRMAELAVQTARVVDTQAGTDGAAAGEARKPNSGILMVRPNVEKGIPFARYVMAMARAKGNGHDALRIVQSNKRWMDQTPQVAQFLMTAVEAGTTTASGWADDLVYAQNLTADFVDLLRPMTIVGRIANLRRVPFNIRVGTKTSGGTAYWVGQGKPIPLSKFATGNITLERTKLAGLMSITEELALDSSPSAEMMVRDDLRDVIVELMDESFIDPDRAAVSGVSPASVTNGVTPVQPTGTDAAALRTDIATLFGKFITANLPTTGAVWITTSTVAVALSMMTNALGQPEFPTVTPQGGTFLGYPMIVSQTALASSSPTGGNLLILALPREIMIADDGGVDIRVSQEASLEMSDAPANDATSGTGASLVSMFQTDSLAIRAIRFVNWKKRRADAVHFINDAEYRA